MAQRISGLTEVDPLSVPLPHGIEVTTELEAWLIAHRRARLQ